MRSMSQKRVHEGNDNATYTEEKRIIRSDWYLTYDVLRIIFKYLNGVNLSNASMVCRSWLEVANDEKRTARGFIQYYNHFFFNSDVLKRGIIRKLFIRPKLALIFGNSCELYDGKNCHCNVLPTNCDVIAMRPYGVIMNNNEFEYGYKVIDQIYDTLCTFLPEIPNVTINTVTFAGVPYSLLEIQYVEQMKTILKTTKSNSHKCLLLFCDDRGRDIAKGVAAVLKQNNQKLSIWGGVVKDIRICHSKDVRNERCVQLATCVGVTLAGLFNSWSVVIDECYTTKKEVEERLKLFRNNVSLRKHSMAFMFACRERGQRMFMSGNVESSIFRNLFPEVPLVGCFGDGEFGRTTIPNEEEEIWYNEISTVFLIITYG